MVSIYASFNDSSLFIHFIMTSKFVCFVIFSYENMLKHLKRYLESLYFFSPCLARENELLIIHSSCGSLGKHIIVSRLLFLVPYPFSEYYLSQDRKNTVEFYGLVLFPKTFLISLAESWSCMSLEKHIWFRLQPVYCTAHFFCLAFFFGQGDIASATQKRSLIDDNLVNFCMVLLCHGVKHLSNWCF